MATRKTPKETAAKEAVKKPAKKPAKKVASGVLETEFGNFQVVNGKIYQVAPYPKSLGKEIAGKSADYVARLILKRASLEK